MDKSQKQKVLLALEEKYPGISKTTRNAALKGIAEWELARRLESATPEDLAECPEYFTLKDAATENEDAPIMETVQGVLPTGIFVDFEEKTLIYFEASLSTLTPHKAQQYVEIASAIDHTSWFFRLIVIGEFEFERSGKIVERVFYDDHNREGNQPLLRYAPDTALLRFQLEHM